MEAFIASISSGATTYCFHSNNWHAICIFSHWLIFFTTSRCHLRTMAAASFIVSFFHQPWLPFLEATEAFIASISSGATNHCFCNNWHAIMHIFPLVDCFLFFNLQTPPPDHGCHIIYSFLFSTNHGCLLALTMAAASFIVSFFSPTTAVHNTT